MRGSHSCTLGIVGLALLLGGGLSWAGGSADTRYGTGALVSDTTGNFNSAFGYDALHYNTTGGDNTASGYDALYYNTTGNHNTATGIVALEDNSKGSFNTANGSGALANNTTGNQNTASGSNALYFNNGSNNTASGYAALQNNSTGYDNTASGLEALFNNTTGWENTAFGYQAGLANTAGSWNTFIGYQAAANAGFYTNGTALGNGATLTASNSIVLGNSAISTIYANVTTITAISDLRRKKDIAPLASDLGLDFIAKLQPVSYRFNNGDETERYGFIAQDLEQALPARLHDTIERSEGEHGLALIERQNDTDRTYRVSYGELFAPMVKAVQEQQREIAAARQENADLRHALAAQAAEIDALRHAIEALRQRVALAQ